MSQSISKEREVISSAMNLLEESDIVASEDSIESTLLGKTVTGSKSIT